MQALRLGGASWRPASCWPTGQAQGASLHGGRDEGDLESAAPVKPKPRVTARDKWMSGF